MKIPQDPSRSGDPAVISGSQPGAVFFCVRNHTAEFQHRKGSSVSGHSFLPVKYRTAVFQFDTKADKSHKGQGRYQKEKRQKDILDPLDPLLFFGEISSSASEKDLVVKTDHSGILQVDICDLWQDIAFPLLSDPQL